ncbi:MAG: cation:proton antiporter [Candidatus Woesearchaeota archaeon]
MQPLLVIVICLVAAYIISELFKLIGLPRVVGQVTAGILLGTSVLRPYILDPTTSEYLAFLANLGIILLFYYVGLETNFKAFKKNLKGSILISLFNTTLPLLIGFVLMRFAFGFSNLTSIIIGISLSVSAQSVSVDMLEEMKLLKSKIGNMIISAGAVDDIIELLLVTIILSSFHFYAKKLALTTLFLDVVIFLIFILLARLLFVPYLLKLFDREHSSTARFMGSMIIVLLIASLADYLGVGLFIGAMVAGMIVRQTIFKEVTIPDWEEHDIAKSTHIVAFGFLIPLFFVWIGINTDITTILSNYPLILTFLAIAVIGTVGGTAIAVMLNKGTLKEGLTLGWGLNPKGDVELVIAALALQHAIITQSMFTALVAMSLLTTIISPIMFSYSLKKFKFAGEKVKNK